MTTILVVDDDAAIRSMLAIALRAEGYEVAIAINGQDGLEQLGRCQPAIILLDLMMPVMDELQMLWQMREQQNATPVILLSGATGRRRV